MRFRDHHIHQIMEKATTPFDRFVHQYFRSNRALGSKDRREIGDTVFDLMRWKGLVDKLGGEDWLEWWRTNDPWKLAPDHLDALFAPDFEIEDRLAFAQYCNRPAPITIRANTLKTNRKELVERLDLPCKLSDYGVVFEGRPQLMNRPEFREGLFELQDEASQAVAALVEAQPGQQVLDYCAGAGGKSLALGAQMQNKGQLFLHDIRPRALQEARKRLARAGVQNLQFGLPRKGIMDRVLVDAPCSGTGAWRRNVDMKWRFTRAWLDDLLELQRKIFAEAIDYLAPSGQIVYATCSVLGEENQQQVEHFCEVHDLSLVRSFATEIQVGGMDGMVGAVLARR